MIRSVGLWLAVCLGITAGPGRADTVRVASFNAELYRDGPGLLLRDIRKGGDPQVDAVVAVIAAVRPDVLALQGVDWDYAHAALGALTDRLRLQGMDYPHIHAARTNAGEASGLDLNGDGRLGDAADAFGYGTFTGQGSMAVLSRFPIAVAEVQSFSDLRWAEVPGHLMPRRADGGPFPSEAAAQALRLSGRAHWVVPVMLPDGQRLTVLTYHAVPPVFDGPEDINGRRNHDETRFWSLYLDGAFGPAPGGRFVLAGSATLDPYDSDGRPAALRALLADPRLRDPVPGSAGAAAAPDQGHRGDNAADTVDWPPPGPGRLRVDYVLPSADWQVAGAGVFWPVPSQPGHDAAVSASRHRLVWVDLVVNPAP